MKNYNLKTVELPTSKEIIAYRQAGTGNKKILLIHGNASSSVHWQTTMAQLEEDFTIYAVDLRGFGDSSYHSEYDSVQDLAKDLGEWLEIKGIDKLTAVGWSAGGGVALELAALKPEVVEQVITIGSVPITGYPMFKKDEAGAPILTERIQTKEDVANDQVQIVPMLNAYEAQDRAFIRMIFDATMYNKKAPTEAEYEAYIDAVLKQKSLVDMNYALDKFNMLPEGSDRLKLVKCKIVMLQGSDDVLVPLDWAKASATQMGDQAEFVLLEGVGHSPMTDDLSGFVETLKKYI